MLWMLDRKFVVLVFAMVLAFAFMRSLLRNYQQETSILCFDELLSSSLATQLPK